MQVQNKQISALPPKETVQTKSSKPTQGFLLGSGVGMIAESTVLKKFCDKNWNKSFSGTGKSAVIPAIKAASPLLGLSTLGVIGGLLLQKHEKQHPETQNPISQFLNKYFKWI